MLIMPAILFAIAAVAAVMLFVRFAVSPLTPEEETLRYREEVRSRKLQAYFLRGALKIRARRVDAGA